eukprot:gene14939-17656_t
MLSAVAPTRGIAELVTGEIDGLTVTDLDSPSALRREMRENYSGNGTTKADKSVMRRLMQVDTLGDSAELQHTPLQHTPLQHTPLQHTPLQHTPLQHTPLRASHESITMDGNKLKARYEFLVELVDHAGLEWAWCTWESLYVFITTKYSLTEPGVGGSATCGGSTGLVLTSLGSSTDA